VRAGGPDLGDDLDAAEQRGLAMLAEASAAIVAGVEAHAAGFVVAAVTRIVDAWGRLDDETRRRAQPGAAAAGAVARDRVVRELHELFAADPADQRATPLEIVRGLRREPTELLAGLGIAPVVRDEFEVRAHPDDVYDLVPRTLGDLGDPDLAPLLLAWGVAKATVLRARAQREA
jgi:hypothetical protein